MTDITEGVTNQQGVDVAKVTCRGCDTKFVPNTQARKPQEWCSERCRVWCHRRPGQKRPTGRTCRHCHTNIDHKAMSAKVCSRECANAERLVTTEREAICGWCDTTFNTRKPTQIYCCDDHQRKASRERQANQTPMECYQCGKGYMGNPQKKDAEHKRTYCSMRCQSEARVWTHRTKVSERVPWSSCHSCSVPFIKKNGKSRCDQCHGLLKLRRWTAGSCQECGDPFISRWHPTWPSRFCSDPCATRNARRAAKDKRRTERQRVLFYGGKYEPVNRLKVFKRDDYLCHICGEPTSKTYSHNDPWSPTIDHIQPIAKRGDHTYENVKCAHAFCNSVKCAEDTEEARQLLGVAA